MSELAENDDTTEVLETEPVIETEAEVEAETPAEDDDEVAVTIGDAPPPEDDEQDERPKWEIRKEFFLQKRKLKELEERNKELEARANGATETKPEPLGEIPTLEQCDYDEEAFRDRMAGWIKRKAEHDAEQTRQAAQQAEEAKAWDEKLKSYGKARSELRVRDFEEAETTVLDTLSTVQQSIIVKGAKNPAAVIYALGKHPGKAKQLAAITDLVEYTFAVAEFEAQVKIAPKKSPPPPERTVTSGAASSGIIDNQLERLREAAARTGDYSAVVAYKRKKAG